MNGFAAGVAAWVMTAAAAGSEGGWQDVRGIDPPLGSLGDVVTLVPAGGLPAEERTEVVSFPGCHAPQVLWLSRFVLSAALAAQKIDAWLQVEKKTGKVLKTRKSLVEAITDARRSSAGEAGGGLPVRNGWMLEALRVPGPPGREPTDTSSLSGEKNTVSFTVPKPHRRVAAVHFLPPAEGSTDRCRPRMSTVLFDAQGRVRVRYHTDFQALVLAELVGDRCETLRFELDAKTHTFRPTAAPGGHGCAATKPPTAPWRLNGTRSLRERR